MALRLSFSLSGIDPSAPTASGITFVHHTPHFPNVSGLLSLDRETFQLFHLPYHPLELPHVESSRWRKDRIP